MNPAFWGSFLEGNITSLSRQFYELVTGNALSAADDGPLKQVITEVTDFVIKSSATLNLGNPAMLTMQQYYDLFGSPGTIMHVVQQVVLQLMHSKGTMPPQGKHAQRAGFQSLLYRTTWILMHNPNVLNDLSHLRTLQSHFAALAVKRGAPLDPNQLQGPVQSLAVSQPLAYTIQWENMGTGNANPVVVTFDLNHWQDPATVQPGLIWLGDRPMDLAQANMPAAPQLAPLPNASFSLTSTMIVNFQRDDVARRLTWTFLNGILPPGGMGGVSFTVYPVRDVLPPAALPLDLVNNAPGALITFNPDPPPPPANLDPKFLKRTNRWP